MMINRMKLSIRLPLLIVITAGTAICLINLLLYLVIRSTVRETEEAALANSLNGYASAVDFFLDEARSVMEITAQGQRIARYYSVPAKAAVASGKASGGADVDQLAQTMLKNSRLFEYLVLLDAKGDVCALAPHRLHKQLTRNNLAFAAWYQKLIDTGRTITSDLHISPATQRPTVIIAAPVRGPGGKLVGIWAGGVNLDTLSKIGISEDAPSGSLARYGKVTDSRGLIIAHQGNMQYVREQTDFSSVPSVQAALGGKTGIMQYVSSIDGQEMLTAYKPLADTNWSITYEAPVKVAFAPLYTLTRYLAGIGALAVIVMGLGSLMIARQVVRPLEQLRNGAITIGMGDLTRRIAITTEDEVGQLASEFNRMAQALADKELQLLNYIARLENANRELEAFSYSVSHDLRAPLRHISGYVELLVRRYREALPEKGIHYLDAIADSAKQMAVLIDDLLQFSRTGRQEVHQADVDMNLLVSDVVQSLKKDNPKRRIEWVIEVLPDVYGDPAMLKQVWFNLLHNAVKFTRKKEEARIAIGCRLENLEYVFFVRDDGVGFDMQYAHKLFGVFQRLHSSEEFEGTGIGLANVRRIIAKHGGRTWAEAVLNQGSVFYFTVLKT